MSQTSPITRSLLDALRSFATPATSEEIEAHMDLALSDDPAVAVERVRIALMLQALTDRLDPDQRPKVKRLDDDRWLLDI